MEKYEILERCYGYTAFRPGQEELIDGVLQGRDVFGIMPTGGGKSLCYQIPGLLLPGITLVISPLISLMRDQVLSLKSVGVPAAYINSTLTGPQVRTVYRNMLEGKYKIVYVAPERLDYAGFGSVAAKLQISFVAVDEAHCISQWGQDFRPSYLRILNFIDGLPKRPVLGAFTATATKQVREDVERILRLQDPVRRITGFDRPNLYFEVLRPKSKEQELLQLLLSRRNKSGIVYCSTRKKVEQVCQTLQNRGYAATRYHAGLEEQERSANQEDFIHDRKTIMVATNAFGMGIDKSNVSFVIHYNMPKSMEAYYQEAGRAGRDGAEADCILLYSGADVTTAKFLIEQSAENEELTEEQRELVRQQDLDRLADMVAYCKSDDCLRGYILDYFGQVHSEICGNCGSCKGEFEEVDVTVKAQKLLSCIVRIHDLLGHRVGVGTVVKVLMGSRDKRLLKLGLEKVSTYGLIKNEDGASLRHLAEHLEAEGYLYTEQEHQTLCLTEKAAEVLYRGRTVLMKQRKEPEQPVTAAAAQPAVSLQEEDRELYDLLRDLRAALARKAGIAPFLVFSNATLVDMATKKPQTIPEFRRISGVGELKASWYGEVFTRTIRNYLDE
jgi:ATP-dependent DNA helicase RecQ